MSVTNFDSKNLNVGCISFNFKDFNDPEMLARHF